MIRIRVEYFGQVRDRTGCAEERVEVPGETSLGKLLADLAQRHHLAARAGGGNPLAPNLVSVNDELINGVSDRSLCDGDTVTILAPIAGG